MSDKDSQQIDNLNQLKDWMQLGCKPPQEWRIGTEHEKLGLMASDLSPIPYAGEQGIEALLTGLQKYDWQAVYEGEHIIALSRAGASVSLEPGGQLELSGAPLENLHQTCAEIASHLDEMRQVSKALGQIYCGIGFAPQWHYEDAAQMPKGRYALMNHYMPSRGNRGLDMMYLSCTAQVNLDYASEADMIEKFRIALALQPLATALFANSPFKQSAPTGSLSERGLIWQDTDPDRTGMLPFVFADDFGFEKYVDYALHVPMYFVLRDGQYIDALGQSFQDFLNGCLPALPNTKPTIKDWENHLTTIFPEARLKHFIEMRGADSGAQEFLCALSAFWVGLLYDETAQKKAYALIADWTDEERETLRNIAPQKGLATPFRDSDLGALADEVLEISQNGLTARAKSDGAGGDESKFLTPLLRVAKTRQSQAEILLTHYQTDWQGEISKAYAATRLV